VKSQLGDDSNIQSAIQDTGAGRPASSADQTFVAIFPTKQRGIGIGMAISKSIDESRGAGFGPAAAGTARRFIPPWLLLPRKQTVP